MSFKCPNCQHALDSIKGLKVHITKLHSKQQKICCKKCPKEFSNAQTLSKHMRKHKEEDLKIAKERDLQIQMNTVSNQQLTEEISGLKRMLSQFMERDTTALANAQSQQPAQTVMTTNNHVQNIQNVQINNITYLNINSTRVREETTQSMFVNGILVYQDDILWRSVLYTHFSEYYPEMQSVAFYEKNGNYTAKRFDLGETPVSVDAKQLAEELMKLRKDDIDYWLHKFFPKFDPKSCDLSDEAYEINQVLKHLADLKNTYIWKKELQRVLEAATKETKRVIKSDI